MITECGQILVSRTDDDPLLPAVCPFKTCPGVRSERPRVYRHHADMCFNMCAWCRYKLGRFERAHGHVLSGHTGVFTVPHNTHHTTHHTAHTPQHKTQHNTTTRPPHHTEIERQRQREKSRRQRRDKRREYKRRQNKTRQECKEKREERR